MKRIAVIGTGISGLSISRMLSKDNEVILFEKNPEIGGLIKCSRVEGNLFHRVGGHVFNSKNPKVLDWFWSHFNREEEFLKAKRHAKIWFNGKLIGYPIENYLYELDKETIKKILDDFINSNKSNISPENAEHFEHFLLHNFGETLYQMYFKPYNQKIWNTDLTKVPLEWLDGKLPMPNVKEMLLRNIVKEEESNMVHATFYYPKVNGSQFIVDRMSEGLNIRKNSPLLSLEKTGNKWILNGDERFDIIIYSGDIRLLYQVLVNPDNQLAEAIQSVKSFKSNGTSNVLCETDSNDLSWLYIPGPETKAHRIIFTGNFSKTNNGGKERSTCVVEFSGKTEVETMKEEIKKLPGNLKALEFNYEPNSYVIQDSDTRHKVNLIKSMTEKEGFYLLGRFAEWEYYNMDKCIEAAFELANRI